MRQDLLTRLDIAERARMLERKRQLRIVQDMEDDDFHAAGPQQAQPVDDAGRDRRAGPSRRR